MARHGSSFANSFGLLKQTFSEWLEDKAPQLGAALAYYTVFSLAPLVLVLLAIVGLIFRKDSGAITLTGSHAIRAAHTRETGQIGLISSFLKCSQILS
jgi:uncharacterized BrkB/YihY/UPF0761 family membrane protein